MTSESIQESHTNFDSIQLKMNYPHHVRIDRTLFKRLLYQNESLKTYKNPSRHIQLPTYQNRQRLVENGHTKFQQKLNNLYEYWK